MLIFRIASTALGAVVACAAGAQQFRATLIDPGPNSEIQVRGLTSDGKVVGWFNRINGVTTSRAFLWENGSFTLLPGADWSSARGANAAGSAVGRYRGANGDTRSAIWQNGVLTDFGTLCGNELADPFRINDQGWVAGVLLNDVSNPYPHNLFLYANGQLVDLGRIGNDQRIDVNAVSNSGTIVGNSMNFEGTRRAAFRWTEATGMQELVPGTFSEASDVNDAGQIVGRVAQDSTFRGYMWQAGQCQLFEFYNISGLNNLGAMVGSRSLGNTFRAFYWYEGLYYDLNDITEGVSGYHLFGGLDISDAGAILARGETLDQQQYPWVYLAPVPEPGSLISITVFILISSRRFSARKS